MWHRRLANLGWSKDAIIQMVLCIADSTLRSYNRMLRKFYGFCQSRDAVFPPVDTALVADFICLLGQSSDRPESVIHTFTSMCSMLYSVYDVDNPCDNFLLKKLTTGVIKSGTTKPMCRSKVMPIQPFCSLFESWRDNDQLTIKDLRLKCIALLSLTCMLRPSDIAPQAVSYNHITKSINNVPFSTDQVVFHADGSASITFLGIKNDLDRRGFEVHLPAGSNPKTDPISCLKVYIDRSDRHRSSEIRDVFLTLSPPFRGISSATVGVILNEAIQLAGLGGCGYSAKHFRSTGGTVAIDSGCDPEIAKSIGRWKSSEVFYKHYVHSKPPTSYVDSILGFQ
jgi:hypothetical protein